MFVWQHTERAVGDVPYRVEDETGAVGVGDREEPDDVDVSAAPGAEEE